MAGVDNCIFSQAAAVKAYWVALRNEAEADEPNLVSLNYIKQWSSRDSIMDFKYIMNGEKLSSI